MKMIFGWFDSPQQTIPAFDPGLDVECPVCRDMLSKPVVTTSLMGDGAIKSYFYRMHKECSVLASPERVAEIESSVIDGIRWLTTNQN